MYDLPELFPFDFDTLLKDNPPSPPLGTAIYGRRLLPSSPKSNPLEPSYEPISKSSQYDETKLALHCPSSLKPPSRCSRLEKLSSVCSSSLNQAVNITTKQSFQVSADSVPEVNLIS